MTTKAFDFTIQLIDTYLEDDGIGIFEDSSGVKVIEDQRRQRIMGAKDENKDYYVPFGDG